VSWRPNAPTAADTTKPAHRTRPQFPALPAESLANTWEQPEEEKELIVLPYVGRDSREGKLSFRALANTPH
jgi:hypothetical protein